MSNLVLSASSLDRFFTCPQQFALNREWVPVAKPSKEMQQGLDVHAIMAGEKRISKLTSDSVRWHVKQMREMEKSYVIHLRETESLVPLTDGIDILRRIDALGVDKLSGEEVVIDYKTTNYMWDEVDLGVAPKAEGFQTACYLLGDDMPSRLDYLVSSANGDRCVFSVWDDINRFSNLLDAARLVQDAVKAKNFPRHSGWLCRYCAFTGPCYDISGWESLYKRRKEMDQDEED